MPAVDNQKVILVTLPVTLTDTLRRHEAVILSRAAIILDQHRRQISRANHNGSRSGRINLQLDPSPQVPAVKNIPAVLRQLAITFLLCCGFSGVTAADTASNSNGSTHVGAYVGNEACAGCHSQAASDWQGSHHDLAMQEATETTVLGDFNNATFTYKGVTSRFFTEDGRYWVETDNARGEIERFPVAYVFGVYPLQQLLLPLSGGRLQALSVAWDSRPAAEGGQRWYHIYDGEEIPAGDPLHWTGPYHNWNTRCAECHSTNVQKNYSATDRSFNTTYDQIDVGCEACHGPGSEHIRQLTDETVAIDANRGFTMSLAARGEWAWAEGSAIAHRTTPLDNNTQIDNCGRCHARRSTLGDYHYGANLLDTHRLATIESPLYWPDGQIRDEVYVYGSFIQSKMHQAGVVCSNCHNPHSNKLYVEGNGLCAQCHQPATYDTPEHHFHPAESTGAQCVECHMPETVYMGVDWRRDHSMRIPRPDLSLTTGSPNACTQCHTDKDASWAMAALNDKGIAPKSSRHPARAFHQAQRGDIRSLPSLKSIVADDNASNMLRASALEHYSQFGAPDLPQTAALLLRSDDPLLRVSGVRAAGNLVPRQRYLMLRAFMDDSVLAVRMAVAEQLASTPINELRPKDIAQLNPLFDEYEQVHSQHLDMPSVQLQLANFWRARGQMTKTEAALREALRINPQLGPAVINLADLLRETGREEEARTLLTEAIAISPEPGGLQHSLGLLEIRAGNMTQALTLLKAAADAESGASRHRYVYAIALNDTGKPDEALALLERLNTELPGNPDLLYALVGYAQATGDAAKANRYQGQLQAVIQGSGLR